MSYTIVLNIVLLVVGLIGLNYVVWKINNIDEIKKDIQAVYYKWLLGILGIVFIVSNSIQTYLCTKKWFDIISSIIYTLLSWMCFAISIVYRETLRIPIANVIGYLFYSKTIEHLVNCINANIKECTDPVKCPKDDERSIFEICTLLRSGKLFDLSVMYLWPQLKEPNAINQIEKSLKDIKNQKDKSTKDNTPEPTVTDNTSVESPSKDIPIPMEEVDPAITDTFLPQTGGSTGDIPIENRALIECISNLFMTCYHRDLVGDIILFSLTGVLCVYISEYMLSTYKCA
jgi:hypothetical protein